MFETDVPSLYFVKEKSMQNDLKTLTFFAYSAIIILLHNLIFYKMLEMGVYFFKKYTLCFFASIQACQKSCVAAIRERILSASLIEAHFFIWGWE